jgi:hypothetical protein
MSFVNFFEPFSLSINNARKSLKSAQKNFALMKKANVKKYLQQGAGVTK